MDKKAKKRLEVIRKKLETLQLRLNGAKQQNDDPAEVTELEEEMAALRAEATKLRGK
ncbi:MAG: hypothetical protein AAFP90_14480 [Planctomycetota bacterium]